MLGRIPQRAPLVNSCMISELPSFSICIQTRTSAPASGMTAIRPAVDGSFLPIAVAARIMTTLNIILIRICKTPLHRRFFIYVCFPWSIHPDLQRLILSRIQRICVGVSCRDDFMNYRPYQIKIIFRGFSDIKNQLSCNETLYNQIRWTLKKSHFRRQSKKFKFKTS